MKLFFLYIATIAIGIWLNENFLGCVTIFLPLIIGFIAFVIWLYKAP